MIQPEESNTKTIIALFFLDPKGIYRVSIYYLIPSGRNYVELKRALIAVQTADKYAIATLAD